jgi:hypothetical protein
MAWSKERIAKAEAWDSFWAAMFFIGIVAMVLMVAVDPLAKVPVLGDRGNEPISLGMN